MKKVGVITFHSAQNSGAVLQCIALQKALRKLGYNPFVIDYRPNYIEKQYKIIINPFSEIKKKKIYFWITPVKWSVSFLAFLKQNIYIYRRISRSKKFTQYINQYLVFSKRYSTYEELVNEPPKSDIYITGSDQLWNESLTGGELDGAYFLKFGSENTYRYTYAISVGKNYTIEYLKKINELIKESFSGLSFRESSLCSSFSANTNLVCENTVDPVFLLSCIEWEEYMSKPLVVKNYILVYALEKNIIFEQIVKDILNSDENLEVVDISPCNVKLAGKVKKSLAYSPGDFLRYIKDAKYVITNSFHCTSFAILFTKKFVAIPHTKGNSRISDLLSMLNLKNQLLEEEFDFAIFESINYSHINCEINKLKSDGLKYLSKIGK